MFKFEKRAIILAPDDESKHSTTPLPPTAHYEPDPLPVATTLGYCFPIPVEEGLDLRPSTCPSPYSIYESKG